jgi:hypothetical protein
MHMKSQPQNDFFGLVSFGRVVFWSSCRLVKLVSVDLLWSSCRLVELSQIPIKCYSCVYVAELRPVLQPVTAAESTKFDAFWKANCRVCSSAKKHALEIVTQPDQVKSWVR